MHKKCGAWTLRTDFVGVRCGRAGNRDYGAIEIGRITSTLPPTAKHISDQQQKKQGREETGLRLFFCWALRPLRILFLILRHPSLA
jgi:hypothetical protein